MFPGVTRVVLRAPASSEAFKDRPGLKVLFMTGYAQNSIVHNGMLDRGGFLIGKPFTLRQLAANVNEVFSKST